MKKIAILMVMMIAWMGITSGTAEGKKDVPAISFKTKTHDYGTIKEADGLATCEFAFTNTGKAPLIIISAVASCGCTTPVYPEQPVQPGKSAVIKVSYNPKGRPGEFDKNVTLRTNDPQNRKVTLKIKGVVIPSGK